MDDSRQRDRESVGEWLGAYLGWEQTKDDVAAEVHAKLIALKHARVADAHEQADALLCALVRAWGYEEIVAVYESLEKWHD